MSIAKRHQLTPMMEQYYSIKKKYEDCILLFRLGDFYETFGKDAITASKELDIVLTSRHKGDMRIPMAGIPHHAAESYISRLVKKGYKVAICEQVEDTATAKGLVKRDVVRVITPGTIIEDSMLEKSSNNYIISVFGDINGYGLAAADVSTGDFFTMEFRGDDAYMSLISEIAKICPSESIMPSSMFRNKDFLKFLKEMYCRTITERDEHLFYYDHAKNIILNHYGSMTLEPFGCEGRDLAVSAAGALLEYIREVEKNIVFYLTNLRYQDHREYMILDEMTQRHLEIIRNMRDGGRRGTLLDILDNTCTMMGTRLLKTWMQRPLLDVGKIKERLDAISELIEDHMLRDELKNILRRMHDIERLATRIGAKTASPRDLIALKNSLIEVKEIVKKTFGLKSGLMLKLRDEIDTHEEIVKIIEKAIIDDPPATFRDGGVIKDKYSETLDNLRNNNLEAKKWISTLEDRERKRTGIKSLKVGFNKVFGYYIEVTKPNLKYVPKNYIRKQTLANAERFITEDLRKYEEIVLLGEERIKAMELQIYEEIISEIAEKIGEILKTARAVATLDVLLSLAECACRNDYCQAEVDESNEIEIKDGRHPVIEKMMPHGDYVPNDTSIDTEKCQIMLITGPNMAGKSTYMRQVAMIVIMAQMGSYVPAKKARIGIVDRIFTRIGAMDDLSRGQSTFMVEMIETAAILNNATPKSLILLDEIGRGTSTFDGMSIAWAIIEQIHKVPRLRARTIVATHYHQLTNLAEHLPRLKNFHMSVKEIDDDLTFIRKVTPGPVDKSYGIQVAKLAGIPSEVIERAKDVLKSVESENAIIVSSDVKKKKYMQMVLFDCMHSPIEEEIRNLDIENMTPIEALNKLHELKMKCMNEKKVNMR